MKSKKPRATLKGHKGYVSDLVFSPDGKTLAGEVSRSNDTVNIQLWNVKTEMSRVDFTWQTQYVYAPTFSDDGKTFAAHNLNEIRVWDVQTGQLKTTIIGHDEMERSVQYLADGKTLVTRNYSQMFLHDVKTGKPLGKIRNNHYPRFSPDGKMYATIPYKEPIHLWNTETATLKMTLPETETEEYRSLAFSPDSRLLASYRDDDNEVLICDLLSGKIKHTITLQTEGPSKVIFLPNRKTLVTFSKSRTVQLWDLNTGELKDTLTKEAENIVYITPSPDGNILAGVDDDGTVRLWNTETRTLRSTLKFDDGFITQIKFSPDGKTLVSNGGLEGKFNPTVGCRNRNDSYNVGRRQQRSVVSTIFARWKYSRIS